MHGVVGAARRRRYRGHQQAGVGDDVRPDVHVVPQAGPVIPLAASGAAHECTAFSASPCKSSHEHACRANTDSSKQVSRRNLPLTSAARSDTDASLSRPVYAQTPESSKSHNHDWAPHTEERMPTVLSKLWSAQTASDTCQSRVGK